MKQVYVIGVFDARNDIVLAGTAFAISPNQVITAYHNIYDEVDDQIQPFSKCAIASSVEKCGGRHEFQNPILVQIEHSSYDNDWAILKVTDNTVFTSFLPICPEDELPDPMVEIEGVSAYHAPIEFYRANAINSLVVWADGFQNVLQYDRGGSMILVDGGLYKGSCGGPYVNRAGKVVGMHLGSLHEAKEGVPQKKRTRSSRAVNLGDLESISSSVKSLGDVHAHTKEGLVLCREPTLRHFLQTTT